MIEPQIYEKWKDLANKRKKSKYQKKYIKAGKHDMAQKKYTRKCIKKDRDGFLKLQRQTRARFIIRKKLNEGKLSKGATIGFILEPLHRIPLGTTARNYSKRN